MTQKELYEAISRGNVDKVHAIIKTNPDLLTQSPDWLHNAAHYGQLDIVNLLLESGLEINSEAGIHGTPLDTAASEGHLEVVRTLLKKGASLQVPRPDRNPLFSAIFGGHGLVAKLLLEAGMDPHVVYRSASGKLKNALSYAQERRRTEIAELLLKAGCHLPVEGDDKPVWQPEFFEWYFQRQREHQQKMAAT
jgi:ankyrin repeat protein